MATAVHVVTSVTSGYGGAVRWKANLGRHAMAFFSNSAAAMQATIYNIPANANGSTNRRVRIALLNACWW